MTTCDIRNFKEKDLIPCIKIIRKTLGEVHAKKAREDFLEGIYPKTNEYVYLKRIVAFKDKNLVGVAGIYTLVTHHKEFAGICWYAVRPEYQKKGIGKLLMQKMEKMATKLHYKLFFVWATKEAAPFYKKFGFKINRRLKLEPIESKTLMTKNLKKVKM